MKRIWFMLIVTTMVLVSMILPVSVYASDNQSDILIAQKNGEDYISSSKANICLDWQGASLINGTACHDLHARVIGYLFEIKKLDKTLGYITVGNALYNYDVLEAVGGGSSPLKNMAEAKAILSKEAKWVNDATPMLVYLGYRQYYDVYISNEQKEAISLQSLVPENFSDLISSIATPDQYQENVAEIRNSAEKTEKALLRYDNPLPVPLKNMSDGAILDAYRNNNNCGPTTGAMISQYWRTWRPNLPGWATDHDELYVAMYTNNWGPFGTLPGTSPTHFGPRWLHYASGHGYSGFITDWTVNRDFSVIQAEIDSGRPMGVMFSYNQSYTNWHWCVVTGYDSPNIIVNDPWEEENVVNWAAVKLTSVITRIQNTT